LRPGETELRRFFLNLYVKLWLKKKKTHKQNFGPMDKEEWIREVSDKRTKNLKEFGLLSSA
jgi:hypothetical protein